MQQRRVKYEAGVIAFHDAANSRKERVWKATRIHLTGNVRKYILSTAFGELEIEPVPGSQLYGASMTQTLPVSLLAFLVLTHAILTQSEVLQSYELGAV